MSRFNSQGSIWVATFVPLLLWDTVGNNEILLYSSCDNHLLLSLIT